MDRNMSSIVLVTLIFSLVLPCEVRSNSNGLWTRYNPTVFIVIGSVLVATRGKFVVATPIMQGVVVPEQLARMHLGPANCDPKKQYWDDVANRCMKCSALCKEERGLISECKRHCSEYTLSLKESKLTTKNITATTVTTVSGRTESVTSSDYSFILVIISITVGCVTFFILMVALLTLLILCRRCWEPKAHILTQWPKHEHVYTNAPTSQSKKSCIESETLISSESFKSQLVPQGLSDTKDGEDTSQDSGVIMPYSLSISDKVSVEKQPCDHYTHHTKARFSKKRSGDDGNSFPKSSDNRNGDTPAVHVQEPGRRSHSSDPLSRVSESLKSDHGGKGEKSEPTQRKGTSQKEICRASESDQSQNQMAEHDCNSNEQRRAEKSESSQDEHQVVEKRGSCSSSNPKGVGEGGTGKPLLKDYEEDTSVYPDEPLLPPTKTTKTESKPYQQNKHIYDQLRKIPWVEGYYSEGKSIQVYVDLLNLEPDWACRQLQLETGQSKEKFHVIHSAQLT